MARLRAALLAFTIQVLLRPVRIGTLALFAAMVAMVTVGAEGWWIVLGIILFQAAAGALTVMWVDTAAVKLPHQPADAVLLNVPAQRRPGPDE